jgi:hypothetical protein
MDLPGKPYSDEMLTETLEALHFRVAKNLIIEIKDADKEWCPVCHLKIENLGILNLKIGVET